MPIGDRWQLLRGWEVLGEIVVDDMDWPWLYGSFIPRPGFSEVKPWFDESTALVEAEDYDGFDRAYEPIEESLGMVGPDGPVDGFLLHIKGDQAWFRC
ncbi:hypothetical protein AB0F71_38330 [Kitasatospora sp. NPDC028055]|uniref:hypothetical protein n=1 Tax=unclassified Kitasatospora TaxID=2633591 RepID=UPI0033C30E7F